MTHIPLDLEIAFARLCEALAIPATGVAWLDGSAIRHELEELRVDVECQREALQRISGGMADIRPDRRFEEARLIATSALTGNLA